MSPVTHLSFPSLSMSWKLQVCKVSALPCGTVAAAFGGHGKEAEAWQGSGATEQALLAMQGFISIRVMLYWLQVLFVTVRQTALTDDSVESTEVD